MDREQPLPSFVDKLLLSCVVVLERVNVSRCEACDNIYCDEDSLIEHLYTHIKCEDTGTDVNNTNVTTNRNPESPLNKLISNIVATLKTEPYVSSRERIIFENDTDYMLSAGEVKREIIEDNIQHDRDNTNSMVNNYLSIIPPKEIKREIIEDPIMVYKNKIKNDIDNMVLGIVGKFETERIGPNSTYSQFTNIDSQHTESISGEENIIITRSIIEHEFQCNICYENFTDGPSLKIHDLAYHGEMIVTEDAYGCEVLKYLCKICGKALLNKCKLKYHMRTHILGKSFECNVCQKRFMFKSLLENHQRVHTNEKPFSCDYCCKFFRNSSSLYVHRHSCAEDKELTGRALKPTCAICNKQFSQKQALLKHIFAIHMTTGYPCSICKREFGHPVVRESHMTIHHSAIKTFKCSVCAKCFVRKDYLNRHMLSHNKPFKCQDCNKKYSRKENLVDHLLRHQKEFPFACHICDKKFVRMKHLNRHNRDVRCEPKSHKCDTCTMMFVNLKKLKKHRKGCLWRIKYRQATEGKRKHFKCDHCKKVFITKRWIIRHMVHDPLVDPAHIRTLKLYVSMLQPQQIS